MKGRPTNKEHDNDGYFFGKVFILVGQCVCVCILSDVNVSERAKYDSLDA